MKRFKGIRMIWMLSFIAIILLLTSIFCGFFVYVKDKVEGAELSRNTGDNHFLATVLDEKLSAVGTITADILYRPATLFPQAWSAEDLLQGANAYRLVTELQSRCTANSILKDIFIYYPEQDVIIGTHGPRNPRTYYYYLNNHRLDGFEAWHEDVLERGTGGYFLADAADGTTELFCSTTLQFDADRVCRLFFQINRDDLVRTLTSSGESGAYQLAALVDAAGKPYVYSGDAGLLQSLTVPADSLADGSQLVDDYYISKLPSVTGGLNYLTVSGRSRVLELSQQLTLLLVFCVALGLFLSIITAFYCSERNTRPMRQLAARLPKSSTRNAENEYEAIQQSLDDLLADNSDAMRRITLQQDKLTGAFVALVLGGEPLGSHTLNTLALPYGVGFTHPFFCVAVADLVPVEGGVSLERAAATLQGRFDEQAESYCAVMDDRLACIINYEGEGGADGDPMRLLVHTLSQWLTSEGAVFRIAVGGTYQSPRGITFSYSEALHLMDVCREDVCFYSESPHKLGGADGGIFYDFQRRIIDRSYGEARELLAGLFGRYLEDCGPAVYRRRRSAVVQLLYDAVRRETAGGTGSQTLEQHCTDLLFQADRPEAAPANFAQVLSLLAGLEDGGHDTDSSLAGRAGLLADCSYTDPMLSLSLIAEKLSISPSHLSRVFKKERGVGLAEYICKKRVLHAKRLIAAGERNVKELARQVGFSSDVTFIRVFKRYENVTPGRFAERVHTESEV